MSQQDETVPSNIFSTPFISSISLAMTSASVAGSTATILASELAKVGRDVAGTPGEVGGAFIGAGAGAFAGAALGAVVGAFSGRPAVSYYLRGLIPEPVVDAALGITVPIDSTFSTLAGLLPGLPKSDDLSLGNKS